MRQVRQHVIALGLGLAGLAAPAHAAPAPGKNTAPPLEKVLDAELPKRMRGRTRPAGSKALLLGTARPLAKATEALGRGDPEAALKALEGSRSDLVLDREALLRGDAYSALGKHESALAAYATALEHAEVLDIGLDATRGLRKTLRVLEMREEELTVTDALLDVRNVDHRADLMLARAQALFALGRHDDAARQAWRVMLDYPTAGVSQEAEVLLEELSQKGVEAPTTPGRLELARIRNLIRAGAFKRAERALEAFEKAHPDMDKPALMRRLDLLRRQGRRSEERTLLETLYKQGLSSDEGPMVLHRLASIAMKEDNNPLAIQYFDELESKFANTSLAREGAYLAAWLPYNSGDNLETHRRMIRFTERYRRSGKRTEALWFAGWSAYLAGEYGKAESAWKTLIDEHGNSVLVLHAWYWLGRIAQKQKKPDEARNRFRQVLKAAPMTYYGFWSQARLEELGEKTVLSPPPPEPPSPSFTDVVARLGANRPRLVDRAVVLHAAGLETEAERELRAASQAFRRVNDTEGRTVVADMLHRLGAHYLAFVLASSITDEGGELQTGEAWAWTAWRQSYPDAFEDEVKSAQEAHDVETNLVWAVMRTESSFRPRIRSPAGARGLMQIMPKTAQAIGRRAKNGRRHAARFREPRSNVWLGAWYLRQLSDRYDGQMAAAIAAYNAGPIAMDRWLASHGGAPLDEFVERIPYKETRRYTRRVMETYFVYRKLKGLPLPELPDVLAKTDPEGDVRF